MSGTLPYLQYSDDNGLQSKLKEELENLREKEYLSYWPRFIIRRVSLYAIPFLMFFAFFFCLGLTKKIGMEKVNIILEAQNVPARDYLLLVVGILVTVLFAQWWCFNREYILPAAKNVVEIPKENYKFVAHIVLIISFVFLFLYIYNSEYKVFYGLLTFLVLTIFPLLIDRTLGLTRQNERFKIYIRRLERLDELNTLREKMNIKFEESHFIEYMKLADEADHSKNQDTVSDTSYFMTLIENKLKA
ncbi:MULTISPECIES: antiviral RADAR system accessory protein RdrD [Serratia]|uniref:antiviral RADAR system accessory protein RdrD n=1 Tax=Serratia TaxID=613 RepID=UPI0029D7D168|nr:antiviral RADAR system accessory protein RdrD [Serratia marcescens]MDX7543833.1 antiviral RADAR system accessory protein RdrD [Serratia marcescens]MDX7565336.1 antiviral RADAR system accessory protein RdrD [Serratia marcescens]